MLYMYKIQCLYVIWESSEFRSVKYCLWNRLKQVNSSREKLRIKGKKELIDLWCVFCSIVARVISFDEKIFTRYREFYIEDCECSKTFFFQNLSYVTSHCGHFKE